jgi:hypothetical protein
MTEWRAEIEDCVNDFLTVAALARDPISRAEIDIEYLPAPHVPPSRIPRGTRSVYGFYHDGIWLKIGKAAPKANTRYTSQHYNLESSSYNLSRSLMADSTMVTIVGSDPTSIGNWIKNSTSRVNILLPATRRPELQCLLETFLHVRLRPRYEGRALPVIGCMPHH